MYDETFQKENNKSAEPNRPVFLHRGPFDGEFKANYTGFIMHSLMFERGTKLETLKTCAILVVLYEYFRHMPSHASREVLVIFGSLTTCDPGDIIETSKVKFHCF